MTTLLCKKRQTMGYARILALYPYVVLTVVTIIAIVCLVLMFTIGELPTFDDPKLGFKARGTEISNHLHSYEQLLESTHSGVHFSEQSTHTRTRRATRDKHDNETHTGSDAFFCDTPRKAYARLVFTSTDPHNDDLFDVDHLKSICRIEQELIRSQSAFAESCIHTTYTQQCCQSWSLGEYIARYSNKSNCLLITEADVSAMMDVLRQCSKYYHSYELLPDCYNPELVNPYSSEYCAHMPRVCSKNNAVYEILHYLTDVRFMKDDNERLQYTVMFLPLAASLSSESLYTAIEAGPELQDKFTRVIAMDLGLKQALFDHYLLHDSVWFAVALLAILLCMWLYTCSLFITIMTVVSIIMALLISYFIYTFVYGIKFFPFMNLMAVVILIGIGADDVFIYCKVWTMAKQGKNTSTLQKLVSDTLKHASVSMFVTSLTTAAAFLASYVSDITALKCFAVFAGTSVICNFILMITWVPACMVIHEKWCTDCCVCYDPQFYPSTRGAGYYLCRLPYKAYLKLQDTSRVIFDKLLPYVVVRLRFVWFILFLLLGIGAMVVVFYYPKLKLPTTNEFQMFSSSHVFEVYDLEMKDKFWFERSVGSHMPTMPLTLVWGVKPEDTGRILDPYDVGNIVYDTAFNLSSPSAQVWLFNMCRLLRGTKYYQSQPGLQLTNCYLEHFVSWMGRGCEDAGDGSRLEPCCRSTAFPYPAQVFSQCLTEYMPMLLQSTGLYGVDYSHAGLRYDKQTNELVALIVEFSSNQPFTLNYSTINEFYTYMEAFTQAHMSQAPAGMNKGWFVSYLDFYSLQSSIAHGTPLAIGVSLAIASIVALLTSLNVIITLYAMLTITMAIMVTMATLTLLGWQLNILESVTISVAVGLSIDFSLHYGMSYRTAPDSDRQWRVCVAIATMASPVTMAAITTLLAGAIIMPSVVLAYYKLGLFLMIVMSVSWLYSTLFFQSLLSIAGPQGSCGQLTCILCSACCDRANSHVDKTVYDTNNQATATNTSDLHELEPLTVQNPQSPMRLHSLNQAASSPYTSHRLHDTHLKQTFLESPPPESKTQNSALSRHTRTDYTTATSDDNLQALLEPQTGTNSDANEPADNTQLITGEQLSPACSKLHDDDLQNTDSGHYDDDDIWVKRTNRS